MRTSKFVFPEFTSILPDGSSNPGLSLLKAVPHLNENVPVILISVAEVFVIVKPSLSVVKRDSSPVIEATLALLSNVM